VKEWQDKVLLITGGGGGMARPTARKFMEQGATVCLADINRQALAQAVAQLADLGPVHALEGDISRVANCRQLVQQAVGLTGRLDALVNTAGVWIEGPAVDMTEEMYDRVMDINLKGLYFLCTAAAPELIKTRGCVVNIGSDAGLLSSTTGRASLYSISKAGVVMLTRALAMELAPNGVRVNVICPGDVDTPMLAGQAREYGQGDPEGYLKRLLTGLPQGENARFVTAEEVAECIYFLASSRVEAITGACLSIDFGSTASL